MNSNNNNYSVVYSNKSPLVSRHPAINGQICSIYSSDVSPNMTHAKLEMDTSNNSSKYAINNNSNLPFQIAKLNTHFAQNNMQNLSFDLGRPKKSTKNSSNMLDFEKPINEDIFTGRRISPKKFTELPKIIIPIACEEDYENEETKLD